MNNLSITQFFKRFPDDETCLDFIFKAKYGELPICEKCKRQTKFYRLKNRKCYECGSCNYKIYPASGTIMEGSTTKLSSWFYAIYLFSVSKNGVSAKELERSLGVNYRTAWRMGHKIRTLMSNSTGNTMMTGVVEMDETLIGGKVTGGKRGWGAENKTCLFGMKERGGRIKVTAVAERRRDVLLPIVKQNVAPGTMINTDEFKAYRTLPEEGYQHQKVVHSRYQWKVEECTTNSIEGYWANLKKSILGTHTYVSPKHLQKYLDEFDFRHNNRKGVVIFDEIMKKI